MALYTFDDDTITGTDSVLGIGTSQQIAPSGSPNQTVSITVASGTTAFTFNPFQTVTVADAGGTANQVNLNLTFSDNAGLSGQTNGATLFTISGGSSAAVTLGQAAVTFRGTAAEAEFWLNKLFIVSTSMVDAFTITLRGRNEATPGSTVGANRAHHYAINIACYLQGTLIRTPAGEQAVEMLRAGDSVVTLDGSAKTVKWIGHRSYEAEFGASEAFVRPVVFKAGSLGGGLPVRDLKVSPQHGMLIDGAMVPAAALVNGVSIVRDQNPGDVSYFHIELDGHEAVFAEGAASETFVDHDSRAMFDNADEYNLIYGTSAPRPAEQPRLEEGFQLSAIRRRLAEIAGIVAGPNAVGPVAGHLESLENGILTGWLVDSAAAEAVEAEVLVDGEVVGRVVANRYRSDLDQAGIGGGRGGFSISLPASAERLEQVTVRRVLDGQVLVGGVLETAGA